MAYLLLAPAACDGGGVFCWALYRLPATYHLILPPLPYLPASTTARHLIPNHYALRSRATHNAHALLRTHCPPREKAKKGDAASNLAPVGLRGAHCFLLRDTPADQTIPCYAHAAPPAGALAQLRASTRPGLDCPTSLLRGSAALRAACRFLLPAACRTPLTRYNGLLQQHNSASACLSPRGCRFTCFLPIKHGSAAAAAAHHLRTPSLPHTPLPFHFAAWRVWTSRWAVPGFLACPGT